MTKHILVLPDGTEISSGMPTGNVIQSVSITDAVNDAQVLSLGSTCASSAEINLITPDGEISIGAGVEIILYRENDAGERKKIGVFITEKPTRPTANTMRITAYDRITKLDKDLSQWLFNLSAWPYSLYSFATMVCEACGLQLVNEEIPHGDYLVQQFSAKGISGRKLMKWVGQICGRFCRATPDGDVEFAWYAPAGVSITPAGEFFYYENTLRLEDYKTYPIEKVQVHLTEDDVGAVWPDGDGEKNTYYITGNYLLTADTTADLQPIAQSLYEQLKNVTYTPCKVTIPACLDVQAGNTVKIIDKNGKSITAYVMRKTYSNQRDSLECTGSYRLDSTTVFNEQTYEALSGKMLEVEMKMEGMRVTASKLQTEFSGTKQEVADLKEQIEGIEGIDGVYFYIKYSAYSDGHIMTDVPDENTIYMGTCSTGEKTAPTDPTRYEWVRVKGDNGADGENAIVCYIDSSTGYTFKAGETATLTARLFDGTEEIDPDGQAPYTWYRKIDGGNYSAFANGKTITISEDVFSQNMDIYFVCGIEDEVDNRAIVGVAVTGVAIVGKG